MNIRTKPLTFIFQTFFCRPEVRKTELCEINPFLRSTGSFNWTWENNELTAAYDMRIFTINEGRCDLKLESREAQRLSAGAAVFLAAGQPYDFMMIGGKSFRLKCVSYDLTQKYRELDRVMLPKLLSSFEPDKIIDKEHTAEDPDSLPFPMPLILHEAAGIVSTVGELITEYLRREPMYEEICSGMLKQIIARALRVSRAAGGSAGGKEALAREVMSYIDLHYGDKIDSNTIAGLFGYHPYYLSRVMTGTFGTTIYKYLIRRRSEEAIRLLTHTGLAISKIAEDCGFADASHLSVAIRRFTGSSPSEIRRGSGKA